MQIKLRKVVYKQELKFYFSKDRKRIPLDQLVEKENPLDQESCDFAILELVGKQVWHRFFDRTSKEYKWF